MENYGSYLFGPTLRDLLAMAALSSDTFVGDDPKVWAAKARRAYGQADAMLSERDKMLASGEAVVEVQSTGNISYAPIPLGCSYESTCIRCGGQLTHESSGCDDIYKCKCGAYCIAYCTGRKKWVTPSCGE